MSVPINVLNKNDGDAGVNTVKLLYIVNKFFIDGSSKFEFSSSKWSGEIAKKFKKLLQILALNDSEDGFWFLFKQFKTIITVPKALGTLQQAQIDELTTITDEIKSSEPTKKSDTPSVCNDFYASLCLKCKEYKLSPPIILYGRLFEEEKFQYISFIFGQRIFVIEISTGFSDIQKRACETILALIRLHSGLPKQSSVIKIQNNLAHIIAEINIQTKATIFCDCSGMDLILLNLNEVNDLIVASTYLMNYPFTWISNACTEAWFFRQPFLEGLFIDGHVFGCVEPSVEESHSQPILQIVFVLCDAFTQSNFLWNEKPCMVNFKTYFWENYMFSIMPYKHIELQPMEENFFKCNGIRFGDQIHYNGPLDIIFD